MDARGRLPETWNGPSIEVLPDASRTASKQKPRSVSGAFGSRASIGVSAALELLDRVVEAAIALALFLLLGAVPYCLAAGFFAGVQGCGALRLRLARLLGGLARFLARGLLAGLIRRRCLRVAFAFHLVGR